MTTNGHQFQRAMIALYRQYLADIGPRCVAEFLDENGHSHEPPTPEQIAAGVDVVDSAAAVEYFLARERGIPCTHI